MLPPRTTPILAIAVAASALTYPFLPRRVATHFDARGRPVRYSARSVAVLTSPAMMAALALLNERLGAWPGARDRENVDSGIRARHDAVELGLVALLSTHLGLLAGGLGLPLNIGRVRRAIYGALLVALGNVMPKLPRNGLIGIRTPWTLADPAVWERTHRLGGYVCMAVGLITLATLPATGKRAQGVPRLALLGAVGVSVAYSGIEYATRTHRPLWEPVVRWLR
jgi:uncharacterized membrane protein